MNNYKFKYNQYDTCQATYRNLKRIETLCRENSIPLTIAYIPDGKELDVSHQVQISMLQIIFKELMSYIAIPDSGFLTEDDYMEDGHFNDLGNRKFADFLEQKVIR